MLFVSDDERHRFIFYRRDVAYVALVDTAATSIPGHVFHDKFLCSRPVA